MTDARHRGRAQSATVRAAKARARLEQLRQHSSAGTPLREAATAIGMSFDGAKNLLKRIEGTARWPMV